MPTRATIVCDHCVQGEVRVQTSGQVRPTHRRDAIKVGHRGVIWIEMLTKGFGENTASAVRDIQTAMTGI